MSAWDRLLDATIAFSFDRSGFERHRRGFAPLPEDLRGRSVAITGANAGLGRAAAHALAARGADVYLLCRDATRGEAARVEITVATGNPRVQLVVLDVSDLDAVRRVDLPPPDVLVHNAGLLPAERRLSAQGLELTFATHVAGPFVLTQRVRAPRVIWVSSGGMYTQRLSLDDLDWSRRPYDGVRAYAQTKRMQVVLASEFAAREPGRVSVAMHPGWADTGGVRTSLPGFARVMEGRMRTAEEGADTVVYLASVPSLASGGFWFDRRPVSPWLLPGTRERPADREALWSLCAGL